MAGTAPAFRLLNPPGLYDPAPNGYSHVAVVAPGARTIVVAGQGGEDVTGALPADFADEVRQAFANLLTALEAVDAGPSDIVKLTVLVVDHSEERLAILGAELEHALGAGHKPTCTLIPVPRLALDGMRVEVEATAVTARQADGRQGG